MERMQVGVVGVGRMGQYHVGGYSEMHQAELAGVVDKVDEPSFATAVGLVFWGGDLGKKGKGELLARIPSIDYTISKMKKWFRGFLP